MRDVIAPAVKQIGLLLDAHHPPLPREHISYAGFEQVPTLSVDRSQFHQVFYNLLSNAIKYCGSGPQRFRVEITAARDDNGFNIAVADYGIGIKSEWRDAIFEEGIRGPEAHLYDVAGQGLGLWVVRQIVEAHGGAICVSKCVDPTTFMITLPGFLTREPVSLLNIGKHALADIEGLLRDRRLPRSGVQLRGFQGLPRLWVERCAVQSAFTHLLNNAVKYSFSDPRAFDVQVEASHVADGFMVVVRDRGWGVEAKYAEDIFAEGVRRPRENAPLVDGQGLGLTIARGVIEAHGGWLRLTNPHMPTEFSIWLPDVLSRAPFQALRREIYSNGPKDLVY
jgi:signal transduction histidine kinase